MSIEHSQRTISSSNDPESIRQRFHLNETPVQWLSDSVSGKEKFRITIHIDGFNPNEINFRVEANKLLIHGEHVEFQSQSSTKKTIEKSYELPNDVDVNSPSVTFPTSTTMQVEFFSRHSNVIYDNGQNGSRSISTYEKLRKAPQLTEQRSSSEFTSTRKIGTTLPSSVGSSFLRNSTLNSYTPYNEIRQDFGTNYGNSYSTSDRYQTTNDYQSPSYSHLVPRYSSSTAHNTDLYRNIGQVNQHSTVPSTSSHNVEVREYSRRISNSTGNSSTDLLVFPQSFNADAFYRSAFQPELVTDNNGERFIEMNLNIGNYEPSDIKISVNGNDLVVQAEHKDDQPPSASSRSFFYKQTTLPSNTDLTSLQSSFHPNGRLQIFAKLFDNQNSIQYN